MSEVRLGRDENFESLLKRFNKKVQQNGILVRGEASGVLRKAEHQAEEEGRSGGTQATECSAVGT